MSDLTPRQFRAALVGAYLLHLSILGLYAFDVFPQRFHVPGHSLRFHHGGDQKLYFEQARGLWAGRVIPDVHPLGFPALLVPFAAIFPSRSADQMIEIVSGFWSLVMFPLGQAALASLARRLTGSRRLAVLSVFMWTSLPAVFYLVLRARTNPILAEIASVHLTWAHMLSDGPATLFALLVMLTLVQGLGKTAVSDLWALRLGALLGAVVFIRYTGALICPAVGFVLVAQRRWRAAALACVAAGLVLLLQFWTNWHAYGALVPTDWEQFDVRPATGFLSLANLGIGASQARKLVGPALPALAGMVAVVGVAGLLFLWRRSRLGACAVALWLGSYLVFHGVYYLSWMAMFPRYMMPAYPAAAIVVAAAVGWVGTWRSERLNAPPQPSVQPGC